MRNSRWPRRQQIPVTHPKVPRKLLSRVYFRPQVILLEERLPLGDALVGPLLAVSWVGSSLGTIPEGEAFAVSREDSLSALSLAIQGGDSLWAVGSNDPGAVEPIEMVSTPSRPISSGLADPVDLGTARAPVLSSGTDNPPEQSVSLAEMPAAAAATQMNVMSTYFGGLGRAANPGLLQTLASVRLSGDGHARPGRKATVPQHSAVPKEQIQANYGNRSLSFEANVGQADASVQFLAHGPGYGLYLTGTEAVMVLQQGSRIGNQASAIEQATAIPTRSASEGPSYNMPSFDTSALSPLPTRSVSEGLTSLTPAPQPLTPPSIVRMQLLGGNATPRVMGEDPLPGKVNYFLGNDPSHWHSNISTFAKVEYQRVYPGIDLVYYGSQQQLEYDFVISPGADPGVIQLRFTGANRIEVDGRGDLVLDVGGQEIRQHKPLVYQEIEGGRQEISSGFTFSGQQVGFRLGAYDSNRPLVIDPVLSYSTYLGGNGYEVGLGIAVDPNSGNTFITGATGSTDFPTINPVQEHFGGGDWDVFVTEMSADGATLVYSTYLGGAGSEAGNAIAEDPKTGNAFITGYTGSIDFPVFKAFQPTKGGLSDAFVAQLNADGSLVYSTYLGGSDNDVGNGIALDPNTGDAIVTGSTSSTNFPTANAFQKTNGGAPDAFVARLSADGSILVYSTYLGGTDYDVAYGIAIDPTTGEALVTGISYSTNFPTSNPFQKTNGGGPDAFAARLSADGGTLVFSTYLGGRDLDAGYGIVVDAITGNVFVTGWTWSDNFPTENPFQPTYSGKGDAFVTQLSANGSTLVYSTYIGAGGIDAGAAIAVDSNTGDAFITGVTDSLEFPTVDAFQPSNGGHNDAFVAQLNTDGSALVYSSYLGGNGYDFGHAIAVDPKTGCTFVTGDTSSNNFPIVHAFQPSPRGPSDAFVTKIC
jgi:hypothetical protein